MVTTFAKKLTLKIMSCKKISICRIILIGFFAGIFIVNALAQSTDLRFTHITTEQGLSNNELTSIAQDKNGFIWIGTNDGLNRFDGYEIKVYRHILNEPTSVLSNFISNILVDSQNYIWIGTLNGISLYNKDEDNFINLKVYHGKDEQTNNYITWFVEDSKGNVLVSNDRGYIFQYDRKKKIFNQLSDQSLPSINCMKLSRDTLLYIGTKSGLFSFNRTTKRFTEISLPVAPEYNPLNISSIEIYKNNIWVGTHALGALIYNPYRKDIIYVNKLLNFTDNGCFRILRLYSDKQNNIWIADAEGIKMFNEDLKLFKSYRHNPNSNYSLSTDGGKVVFVDCQKNKWIGTSLGGLNVAYERKRFHNLKPENEGDINLTRNIVSTVTKDRENNLWIGYFNEGIDKITPDLKAKSIYLPNDKDPNSLGHSTVQAIFQDRKGNIWTGTYTGGLELFDKQTGKFHKYQHDPQNPGSIACNDVRSIVEDKQGNLWIVAHGVGIDKFDPQTKKFYHYTFAPSNRKWKVSNWNFKLLIDSYDTLWLAGTTGLCKMNYDGTIAEIFTMDPSDRFSLSNKYLNDVFEDNRRNLWVGTYEGLNYFNRKTRKFTHLTTENGLLNDNIKAILEDKDGNIWASSNKGITKIAPKFDNANNLISYDIRNYDERDGIESNAFFDRAAYFDAKANLMYFGGLKGITYFQPDNIKDNPQPPTVVFTDFKLFYKSVSFHDKNSPLKKHISQTRTIRLNYTQNVLTFEYSALNFIVPGKNQFAYIMEGFDKKWNYVGAEHKATYTNLDPGTYTFKVKAANNDGLWNEEPASVVIIIEPPFWKSFWGMWIIGMALVFIVYLSYRFITYRAKLKNELQLAHIEAKKVQEIGQLKINFFTQISHEFRTPLTLIISPLEKLMNTQTDDQTVSNDYKLIYKNVQRLKRLINQLLDFRTSEEGFLKLDPTYDDIILFISGIVSSFDALSQQRNIRQTFDCELASLYMWFDPDKIEKILYNLISNAIKYTPDGGSISIHLKLISNQNILPGETLECLEISVSDNGIGIESDVLQKIFLPFYQVEGKTPFKGEGTGIGLALTKKLVEIHKGKISVKSSVGQGSIFTVTLPVDRDSDNTSHSEESRALLEERVKAIKQELDPVNFPQQTAYEAQDEKKPLLLIAEDNADLLNHLHNELQKYYRVALTNNGMAALHKALEIIPDLIISDIMMPEMDGMELCRNLKTNECTSHIPVILLTARPLDEHKIEGYEVGADDYITKPFSIQMLLARVKNLIENRKKLRTLFGRNHNFTINKLATNATDELFLNKALSLIQENLADCNFGPQEFAKALGMSRSQLYRKIEALTDKSVSEFITSIKLNRAAEMLLENKYTISEVAYAVGFTEQSNFTRSFTKQFGKSPSNFIQSMRSGISES